MIRQWRLVFGVMAFLGVSKIFHFHPQTKEGGNFQFLIKMKIANVSFFIIVEY